MAAIAKFAASRFETLPACAIQYQYTTDARSRKEVFLWSTIQYALNVVHSTGWKWLSEFLPSFQVVIDVFDEHQYFQSRV
jgi:hypothetical protein